MSAPFVERAGQAVAGGIGRGRPGALVERVARRRGPPGGGAVLETVTVVPADVAELPAASRARASVVCEPFVAVAGRSHAIEYGAVVSSAPRLAPSSRNWTPATPTLSLALAVTDHRAAHLALAAGAVIATVGGVVSRAAVVVAVTVGRRRRQVPAASSARTAYLYVVAGARPESWYEVVLEVPTCVPLRKTR